MDISMLERLVPHIAWPVAAFAMFIIAVPIIYVKLSDLSRAILALKEMPNSLSNTLKEFENLAQAVSHETKSLAEQVDELQSRMNTTLAELTRTNEQIRETQSELQSAQLEFDESQIDAEARGLREMVGTDPHVGTTPENIDEMYEKLVGRWTIFERELKARVEAANGEYDPKRPGKAASVLLDRRRRLHITTEQQRLISRLGRQYRKFEKLADDKENWLNQEVYSTFMTGLEQVLKAIRGEQAMAA